jgi:hypothetical protein
MDEHEPDDRTDARDSQPAQLALLAVDVGSPAGQRRGDAGLPPGTGLGPVDGYDRHTRTTGRLVCLAILSRWITAKPALSQRIATYGWPAKAAE